MSVKNVKVKSIRPEYNNLKEWMEDSNNVYIGRRGIVFIDGRRFPEQNSKWCNPFKIKNISREKSLKMFKENILEKIKEDPDKYNIEELRGKNLGCWCHPEICHGDILMELIDQFNGEI